MGNKIFSYGEKYRLKQLAKSFQIYAKENELNIKLVKDIRSEDIQDFLEKLRGEGVHRIRLTVMLIVYLKYRTHLILHIILI